MKTFIVILQFISIFIISSSSLTVEEAYAKYEVNSKFFLIKFSIKFLFHSQELEEISAFNAFKMYWNYARVQIRKYENTVDAWSNYKKDHGLQFTSPDEESKRILIFRENTGKFTTDLRRFVEGETSEFPNFYQSSAMHLAKDENNAVSPISSFKTVSTFSESSTIKLVV